MDAAQARQALISNNPAFASYESKTIEMQHDLNNLVSNPNMHGFWLLGWHNLSFDSPLYEAAAQVSRKEKAAYSQLYKIYQENLKGQPNPCGQFHF